MTTTLYRFYDADDRLLYVGIAGNPGRRFEQHAKTKAWWSDVTHSTMEHYATREEAAVAEVAAIVTERPLHNVVHANRRSQPSTSATSGRLADGAPWWIRTDGQFGFLTIDRSYEPPAEHREIAKQYAERGVGALRALGYVDDILYGCDGAVWSVPCLMADAPSIIAHFDRLAAAPESQAARRCLGVAR